MSLHKKFPYLSTNNFKLFLCDNPLGFTFWCVVTNHPSQTKMAWPITEIYKSWKPLSESNLWTRTLKYVRKPEGLNSVRFRLRQICGWLKGDPDRVILYHCLSLTCLYLSSCHIVLEVYIPGEPLTTKLVWRALTFGLRFSYLNQVSSQDREARQAKPD